MAIYLKKKNLTNDWSMEILRLPMGCVHEKIYSFYWAQS